MDIYSLLAHTYIQIYAVLSFLFDLLIYECEDINMGYSYSIFIHILVARTVLFERV